MGAAVIHRKPSLPEHPIATVILLVEDSQVRA
jgi:hypothetical protein